MMIRHKVLEKKLTLMYMGWEKHSCYCETLNPLCSYCNRSNIQIYALIKSDCRITFVLCRLSIKILRQKWPKLKERRTKKLKIINRETYRERRNMNGWSRKRNWKSLIWKVNKVYKLLRKLCKCYLAKWWRVHIK